MKKTKKISLIIPCLNEEESLPIFYDEVTKVIKKMNVDYELLLIDDGSSDNTRKIMEDLAKKDKKVKFISFSRNFGKEAAMFAGFSNASGDYVAVMDADMQDPPEKLIEMYEIIKSENYDCVALYTESHEGYNFIRKGIFDSKGIRTRS